MHRKITVSPLTKNPVWLGLVEKWSQEESGGLMAADDNEIEFIRESQHCFYIIEYGDGIFTQPVGMFALFEYSLDEILQNKLSCQGVCNLDYFYIVEAMRGHGIGGIVMQRMKEIAKKSGAELIVFDTLTPHLNHFYERNGATIVCDNWFNDKRENKMRAATHFRMSTK